MDLSWACLLLLLILVDIGVLVALVALVLGVLNRGKSDQSRRLSDQSAGTASVLGVLIVGPSESILVGPAPAEALIIGPRDEASVVIGPAPTVSVEPPQRPAWDDRGWAKRTENDQVIYEGEYQIADGRSAQRRRFRGVVVVSGGEVVPYIADPPLELRHHPKHACFQLFRPPWFKLHWHRAAGNVDDAIIYIERVLDEAINGRRAA